MGLRRLGRGGSLACAGSSHPDLGLKPGAKSGCHKAAEPIRYYLGGVHRGEADARPDVQVLALDALFTANASGSEGLLQANSHMKRSPFFAFLVFARPVDPPHGPGAMLRSQVEQLLCQLSQL